jgi:heptosyltransferase III
VPGRFLVIRGGAIGDFVLTLPALRLLREGLPEVEIELLGYRHITELAVGRFYAKAARSIEYGALASFFARNADLPQELVDYFGSFDQILSYLYDPDEIFRNNLARCRQKDVLVGSPKFHDQEHVSLQLARPLEQLALFLENPAAELFPSMEDEARARALLPWSAEKALLLHIGSGSPRKNWPARRWREIIDAWLEGDEQRRVAVLAGESDAEALGDFGPISSERIWLVPPVELTTLAALARMIPRMMGHDSGISHIAAAVGARCLLLFGPTDPAIWAPLSPKVRVCRAESRELLDLSARQILPEMESWFDL